MPEVVGQAIYELDVNLDKFDAKLATAEAKLKGSTSRVNVETAQEAQLRQRTAQVNRQATAEAIAGSQRIVTSQQREALARLQAHEAALLQAATQTRTAETQVAATAKTTAATTRLTAAQKIQQSLLRTGASQIASSTLGMSRFSSAVGGVAAALPGLGFGLIGAVTGFELLDTASQHFTGVGIIDYLTGQAEAHRKAALAAQHQAEVEEDLARLAREGVRGRTAPRVELVGIEEELQAALDARRRAEDALLRAERGSGRFDPATNAAFNEFIRLTDASNAQLDEAATKITSLGLNYKDLAGVVQRFPELKTRLSDELQKQADAAGAAAVAIADYELAVDNALAKQAAFAGSLRDLTTIADVMDPQIEKLRLEQIQLQQLETKMGDAFGKANQARLQEVTRLLDLLESRQDLVTQSLTIFGAEIRQQYGELAPAALANVASLMAKLPDEQKIKLAILLPDLFGIAAVFQRFIAQLQAGASVEVAVRFAAIGAFPSPPSAAKLPTERLPGETNADFQRRRREAAEESRSEFNRPISPEAQRIIDETNRKLEEMGENSLGPLGNIAEKTGSQLTYLQKVMQAVSDGTITLSEAMELGLSDAQVVTLELEFARNQEANAAFRTRIALQALVRVYPGLNAEQIKYVIGLQAIQRHLNETGQTVEQFLRDVNAGVLDTARSAIDQLLGGPTREDLQLQLREKELERRRLLILQGGADKDDPRLKRIDRDLEAIRTTIELRQNEIDQMRIRAQLVDNTIRSDIDLANAFTWLYGVVGNFSKAVQDATTFLQDFAGMGRGSEPSFASGISYVPHVMRAVLHPGERVLTASENRQLGAGMTAPVFQQHYTINGEPSSATIDRLAAQVEQANLRSLNRWRGNVMGSRGTN